MKTFLVLLVLAQRAHAPLREVRVPAPTLDACLADGDKAALAWLTGHPGWRLVGWRCDPVGRR